MVIVDGERIRIVLFVWCQIEIDMIFVFDCELQCVLELNLMVLVIICVFIDKWWDDVLVVVELVVEQWYFVLEIIFVVDYNLGLFE